jgi:acetyl esterase/lipase
MERQYGNWFVSQGYVVVAPDFRGVGVPKNGAPGSGAFPQPVDDVAAATIWAQDHAAAYGADANRVALLGEDIGATVAALLAERPNFAFATESHWAANEIQKPERLNVVGFIGDSGYYRFADTPGLPWLKVYLTGVPAHEAEPFSWASKSPPALLIDGASDTLHSQMGKADMAIALTANGVAHLVESPPVGHDVSRRRSPEARRRKR